MENNLNNIEHPVSWITFVNVGFIQSKFSTDILAPIRKEAYKVKQDFLQHEEDKANKFLAGNIEKEYSLKETKQYAEDLLMPFVQSYDDHFNYLKDFNVASKDCFVYLDRYWVNFQKKYEFNPAHTHGGLLSFVLWLDVPYTFEEEKKVAPGIESNGFSAGMFEMLYTRSDTRIKAHRLVIDKSMEGTMVLFPATLHHQVYPFFSSDDYRISVSGNFKFKVD